MPQEIASQLSRLFQPAPVHEKLFYSLLKFMEKDDPSAVWFGIKNFLRIKKSIKHLPDTNC